jgi:hypothetical protein
MSHFSPELKQHVCTAADVTATEVVIGFDFQVGAVQVALRTAAGVAKAYDGAVVVAGTQVTLDNTGTSDFAATDVFTVLAGRAA